MMLPCSSTTIGVSTPFSAIDFSRSTSSSTVRGGMIWNFGIGVISSTSCSGHQKPRTSPGLSFLYSVAGLCNTSDRFTEELLAHLVGVESDHPRPDTVGGEPARRDIATHGARRHPILVGHSLDRDLLAHGIPFQFRRGLGMKSPGALCSGASCDGSRQVRREFARGRGSLGERAAHF